MKKNSLNTNEIYILKSFLESKYPRFAKTNQLANENVEYLLGLCQRCLNGDNHLSFPLNITTNEEDDIQIFIEQNYNNSSDEWLFFYLMKCVRIILEKYYDKNGEIII